MSLINQVLSDLERRGANSPLADDSIRAVPARKKVSGWLYLLLVMVALPGGLFLAWPLLHGPEEGPRPAVALPAPAASRVAAVPQALPASQPAAASTVAVAEPLATPVQNATLPLNFERGTIPLPDSPRGKPLAAAVPRPAAAAPVVADKAQAGMPVIPETAISKQLKKVSVQQQAENEYRKANLLAQQGRLKEAVTGYEAALQIDPLHAQAREALVAVLLESRRSADAEKILQEGTLRDAQHTRFAMLLARLQVERNALPLALETLEKSLAYADQQADYQAFMAALLQRQDRHKEAITHYQLALQLSPGSALWLMGLGISLQAVQRNEDALDVYQRALELHSLNPELQAYVAQRMKELGK